MTWQSSYPTRAEILTQITRLWDQYGLESYTRFNTKVTSLVQEPQNLWIVNGSLEDKFDGIIIATGTCGRPRTGSIPQKSCFKGQILHSSELSGKNVKDQRCAVIGGGASAVEAMDFLVKNEATEVSVIARVSDLPPLLFYILTAD